MGSSTLILDYLGSGTHAARQATPPIPAGASAIYAETDTGGVFAFIPGTGWTQFGFTDAPADGNLYVRHDNAWEELPAYPAAGVPEAPDDGNPYVRQSDGWAELPAYPAPGIPEAPDDGQTYGRKSEAWAVVGGGGGGGGYGEPYFPQAPAPPTLANTNLINGTGSTGTLTALSGARGLLLQAPAYGAFQTQLAEFTGYVPPASGNFRVSAFLAMNSDLSSNWHWGLYVKDSAGKFSSNGFRNSEFSRFDYSDINTLNDQANYNPYPAGYNGPIWFSWARIGANLLQQFSIDGESWFTVATIGATSFLGATLSAVGVSIGSNTGSPMGASIFDIHGVAL